MLERAPTPPLFGSSRRTEVLVLLALLGESYPAELERLLGVGKATVLQIVDGLERDGIVASRALGRTRRLSLEPRWYAAKELLALLERVAQACPNLVALAEGQRRRPRRKGKSA
jgi:predicted transcriptional regulator